MSIPLPQGFRAAGLHCGIKKDPAVFDLSLFVSDRPATSAGLFTQNRVCGAPVKVSRERIRRTTSRAVVINSGNSNACTGEQGIADAKWMTGLVAEQLHCAAEDVCVCSTGVIGRFLPKDKLAAGIPRIVPELAASDTAFEHAARGIMTTDTRVKMATRTLQIQGQAVRISGCSKGAAMIGPNMATMLCVIMTDASLTVAEADQMLRHSVDRSFNSISVEGHTSTSDTVILLANGAAAGGSGGPLNSADASQFQQALDEVAADLAMAIISDATAASNSIRTNRDTHIQLDLTLGTAAVRYWTSDLTAEYVRLNADYTT